jgi:hypothetical protein
MMFDTENGTTSRHAVNKPGFVLLDIGAGTKSGSDSHSPPLKLIRSKILDVVENLVRCDLWTWIWVVLSVSHRRETKDRCREKKALRFHVSHLRKIVMVLVSVPA